jgi:hypothetical protein
LFASNSWFVRHGEKEYQERLERFNNQVGQAMDKQNNEGDEKGREIEHIA